MGPGHSVALARACSTPLDVVAVDGSGIADSEGFEERVGSHHFAQGAGETVHARVGEIADTGELAEEVA